ncbi:MAG: ABC transporter ATP-binding protein [Bacillota bacterium]
MSRDSENGAPGIQGIRMSGIVKVYPPDVLALDNVDIMIRWGTIHSIIGENGAGKSTLMKVLYGITPASAGRIFLDGRQVRFASPRQAVREGIGMVHQELMLIRSYTVWENVVVGSEPAAPLGTLKQAEARARVEELVTRWGLNLDPDAVVGDLSVSAQQKVEILKLLYRDASVLIMDEPTAVLTPQETSELFARLRQLNQAGGTIIFISHKLQEVLDISDEITVMRKGKRVMTAANEGLSRTDLARAMVGRDVVFAVGRQRSEPSGRGGTVDVGMKPRDAGSPAARGDERPHAARPALEVRGLSFTRPGAVKPALSDVSFDVSRGEILGVAGVEGNGQFELVQCITGALKPDAGSIRMDGRDVTGASVMERRRLMCSVPQDRKHTGSAQTMSITDNAIMAHHRLRPSLSARWRALLDPRACRGFCVDLMRRYSVVAPGPDAALAQLSGGNQQKVIVGREFSHDTGFVLLDNPTRGLDVGSIEFIHRQILNKRSGGAGCLLVSADLDELLALCDRILVMYEGRVAALLDGETADREAVGRAMLGLELSPEPGPGPGSEPEPEAGAEPRTEVGSE